MVVGWFLQIQDHTPYENVNNAFIFPTGDFYSMNIGSCLAHQASV